MRGRLVLGAVALAVVALVAGSPAGGAATVVHVDAGGASLGPADRSLLGLGWNHGPSLEPVASLQPPVVRIDARLEQWNPAGVIGRIAEVRRIGAEPQVILSYLPPSIRPPIDAADLDRWEAFVGDVVRTLAVDGTARRFEVWNEPELPTFWPDTPAAFLALALRTHRAVAAVEAETGLPLEIGGPASVGPVPHLLVPYVRAVTAAGLPLDFVSWHYYANYPALGPDGNEGFVPDAVYRAGAHRNPFASPRSYGLQIPMVRAWVDAASAGRPGGPPPLVIDEWNLSAGGYDLRHDTNEGAALAAGVLVEMERAGLDGADFYRAVGSDHPGDWGMTIEGTGAHKPVHDVFAAWGAASGERVGVTGDDPAGGLWVRAARDGDVVRVLLATFRAQGDSAHQTALALDGCDASTVSVSRVAGPDDPPPATVAVEGGAVALALPGQSVTLVEATC